MARDKTDETDKTPAATAATIATNDELPTEAEIVGALELLVSDIAPSIRRNETLLSGWHFLAFLDLSHERIDGKYQYNFNSRNVERVLFRARGCRAGIGGPIPPDPYAFDAACHLGAKLLRAETELPTTLRDFLVDVLSQKITRHF